ncbi:hypothetical protein CWO92_18435 [Heyndrickxia camelliae]|uniref:Uncharacterized protein n=2 Tax=Heyndrickxia camelliae TaxID=1707093 RepID=A0A2N3LG60_9BACI|nr:hypothetical protein CWO92_18435 [Heyndrickxia camelliae]
MAENTREELSDLTEKLYEEIRLVEVYIENHEGIKDSTWKDIEGLLSKVYNRLDKLEDAVKYS